MKCRTAGLLVAAMLYGTVAAGCSQDQVQKEAGKYTMQAYEDGVLRAQSQGKGLNGRFLTEMRQAFAEEQLKLTHERFTEDGRGTISYQYLINSKPSQTITLHVFSSPQDLTVKIPNWYGSEPVAETTTTKTEIYNKDTTSLVYTSMGKEKGKYSDKVKALFTGLLQRLGVKEEQTE
ncbi:hypothetical protein J7E73_30660 [Paenibacillus albidus]|uniref:hypothetical protein n=1 Tax=Paenibacillus albidus TaxID=2041023 RepID=UPI001BE536EE|nr:hypothetical protein [Paenibacillus albidus]MBT2293379.1 hypothetical protein [Paenibacillus albidus]